LTGIDEAAAVVRWREQRLGGKGFDKNEPRGIGTQEVGFRIGWSRHYKKRARLEVRS